MSAPNPLLLPSAVLDTNTLLDWFVFRDAGVAALTAAVTSGQLRWIACRAMRDELERTLGYRNLVRWSPDSEQTLADFDLLAVVLPEPQAAPLDLRCTDPDDQVFVDLALAHAATWLVTHDRALLRLARRARRRGLEIVTPAQWIGAQRAGRAA